MKIIAEAGATKTDWRILDGQEITGSFKSDGINLATMSPDTVKAKISSAAKSVSRPGRIEEIYFYGAGIVGRKQKEEMSSILRSSFSNAVTFCESDLTGAARALFGRDSGIVAILGTGSNSCFYDGTSTISKVRSGGFILGDEGSGAFLGKMLLSDFIKGLVPDSVAEELRSEFDLDYQSIVREVYSGGEAAAFLASFAPYVLERQELPYMKGLIIRTIDSFVGRMLGAYDTANFPVGVVGGFGYACRQYLEEIGQAHGIRFSKFVQSPIEELVKYHV